MWPPQGRRNRYGVVAALVAAAACGSWQGAPRAADPALVVPRLFDAAELYEDMGLFAAREPLAFVASVRFLATATADSTLGIVGVSLANKGLSFRRAGDVFEAAYHVDITFRDGGTVVRQVASDERVRVAAFDETLRADESVVFQRFVPLPPGRLRATIAIRDRFGSGFSRAERTIDVPSLTTGLSPLVPVYRAAPRRHIDSLPAIVVNPRATAAYGVDTLVFYIEAYGVTEPTEMVARALHGEQGAEIWRDTVALAWDGRIAAAVVRSPPDQLPVGELTIQALVPGRGDTVGTKALVSFSDRWAIANFDQTLSLLRYFGHDDLRQRLRDAAPEQRSTLWKALWTESDPNPVTPEHEALNAYFRRLQDANERFEEAGQAGWLTDRGEVYITLGEPDDTYRSDPSVGGRGQTMIRWTYAAHRLALTFVDESGFGRFRLTSASRQEYLMVLSRVRRNA